MIILNTESKTKDKRSSVARNVGMTLLVWFFLVHFLNTFNIS